MGSANYAGFGLSFIAGLGMLFCTMSNEWKRNSKESSQANLQQVYTSEGLWKRCTSPIANQVNCDNFDVALIGVEAELQAERAMMVLSCIFIFGSVITSILAVPCTAALDEKAKKYSSWTGGAMAFLAGCLTLAAVSWYAADVVEQFRKSEIYEDTMFVYEFGSALYVGWVSSILALAAGGILLCCNCGSAEDGADDYPYTYNPAKPQNSRPNTEYV